MQQHPGIDRTLIEEHIRLGYTESEIKDILKALQLNASTAGIESDDPRWVPWINRALAALRRRFQEAVHNGQYSALLIAGYTVSEIRDIHFANLLPTTQLIVRTNDAHNSGEYQRVHQLGYPDVQVRSLICAGFTVSQLRALADRMSDAQKRGVDSQGLTFQQLDDMLFKKRSMNGVQTLGVVRALLSGIHFRMREGEIARCIIDYVTLFDVPYGLGGVHGQVDVGTRRIIIEAKVDRVRTGQQKQVSKFLKRYGVNPPDANGMRKWVILYAPGYDDAATVSMQSVGVYVVKSCGELRKQIRQLGGP